MAHNCKWKAFRIVRSEEKNGVLERKLATQKTIWEKKSSFENSNAQMKWSMFDNIHYTYNIVWREKN